MNKKSKVIVIDPYDSVVQKAINELGPSFKDVDIIKLETNCPGDRLGWVANKDYLENKPGKEKVIHLCLNKIKDQFKKQFGTHYHIMDPDHNRKVTEIIKDFLKSVILPHEAEHIQQVVEHGGEFGPGSEQKAEKVEDWGALKQYGLMKKLSSKIDIISDTLELRGFIKSAYNLDIIANTLEKISSIASLENYLRQIIQFVKKGNRDPEYIKEKIKEGFVRLWPGESKNPKATWLKVLKEMIKSPGEYLDTAMAFQLNSKELEEYTMPIEQWAQLANMPELEFKRFVNDNASGSEIYTETPTGENRNPVISH